MPVRENLVEVVARPATALQNSVACRRQQPSAASTQFIVQACVQRET